LDDWSDATGYGFTAGYVDKDFSLSFASGPKSFKHLPYQVEGDMEPTDMMQMGSGTKPFTSVAVMKLVE
jgi:hypothetical protein